MTQYNLTTDFSTNNLVGDGTTDNKDKWNAILAALPAPGSVTSPCSLYCPAGTYIFTADTLTALPSGVTLFGDGKEASIFKFTRTSRTTDNGMHVASNTILRDMAFIGDGTANAVYYAMVLNGVTGVFMERCKFAYAFTTSLRFANASQVFASQCEFAHCADTSAGSTASIVSGSCIYSSFVDCWFHDNDGVASTNHCFYLSTNTTTPPHDVVLTGCVFQNHSGGNAVAIKGDPYHSWNINVVGNTFYSVNTNVRGAMIAVDLMNFNFNDNTIAGGGGAVTLFDCYGFSICGNQHTSNGIGAGFLGAGESCKYGRIAGNVLSFDQGTGTTVIVPTWSFGNAISLTDGSSFITIENNKIFGWMLAVSLLNTGVPNDNITIRNNEFSITTGATLASGAGQYYFGNSGTSYGVGVDGTSSHIKVIDNTCTNLNYELYFAQFTYTGVADQVRFRSDSWGAPLTAQVAVKGGSTGPTNFARLTTPSMVETAGVTGTAFTAVSS